MSENDIEKLINELFPWKPAVEKTKEQLISEIETMVKKCSMEELKEIYLFIGNNF